MPHDGTSPISFTIEGREDQFTDVKNIQQVVVCRVRKLNQAGAKENLGANDTAIPYCGFLYTMFHDVEAHLRHKLLYRTYGYYDLMTYLQILTGVPTSIKNYQMSGALWFKDQAGAHSVVQADAALNYGEYRRGLFASGSATFEMQGKLMLDCFQTERPIPNRMGIDLYFYPNETKKCVLSGDPASRYVLEIMDMYLIVPRIIPKTSLLNQPSVIPYTKTECYRMNISANSQSFGPRNVVTTDNLPRKCLIVLLTEAQMNGSTALNRQEFNPRNVNQILLQVNGEHLPVYEGYKPNWDTLTYGNLYNALFTELGTPDAIDIRKEDFKGGFVIFAFNLDQRYTSSDQYPPKRSGAIDLTLNFRAAVAENLVVLVFLESERVYRISKNREFVEEPAVK